jgi:DNA polymerase I
MPGDAAMELDALDVSTETEAGQPYLRCLTRTGGGKEVVDVPAPFEPYCYIEEDAFTMRPLRASSCRVADGGHPDGFLRIVADHPGDIRGFARDFTFRTYEADVGLAKRACINTGLGIERPDPGDVLYFDIEVDDRGGFTEPGDAGDRIIAIAGAGGDGRELYFDDADERVLIEGFLAAADDYAVLAGWNSIGYDYEYLDNRCVEHGMDVDWRRWARHDVMPLYDMLAVPTKTVSTKLGNTAQRELGEGKADVQPGGGELYGLWQEAPGELRGYNVQDADLVRRIDDKYGLVDLLHIICGICDHPPGDACYESKHGQVRFGIGSVVDSKLLGVAHRRGEPQHDRGAFDKGADFPGGYVLDPVPGMHEDVVVPDYSGMYPNIVRAWNFGRGTFVEEEHVERDGDGWAAVGGRHEGRRVIRGETGGFVHPDDGPRSVPAEAADGLVEMREGADEAVDKGVKAVNNCFSGDTEVMTPDRGPVNIKELEVGDEVYSINPDTLKCEAKPVVGTVAEPNKYGELVHIQGQAADLKVTPNHRMLASRDPGDGFDFCEASELETCRWELPEHEATDGVGETMVDLMQSADGRVLVDHNEHGHTFRSNVNGAEYAGNRGGYWLSMDDFWAQEAEVLDRADVVGVQHHPRGKVTPLRHNAGELLELVGWYIAEGCNHSNNINSVTLHQEDDEGRARITDLLDGMGVPYAENDTRFRINDRNLAEWLGDNCGRFASEKRIPDWVFKFDAGVLGRLREALMAGDGHRGRGIDKYTTVSPRLRDDYARLLVEVGETPRLREDGAFRIHVNSNSHVAGHHNVKREDHDGMVYCVSVLDNHTVLAGRNGTFQWTGQTLYGVFGADFYRYFGPHSENITLIGQELTGIIEDIAGDGHPDIERVVYGDTDSIMVSMDAPEDRPAAARRIAGDVEREMREWAAERGADPSYLELDVDDIYSRFYIGDKKKRYFGRRTWSDGGPADDLKIRGFEARKGDWPEPMRDLQVELMGRVLDGGETQPVVDRARDELFDGRWDLDLATATTLTKPIGEYETYPPHVRAAEMKRSDRGHAAAAVGDKVEYVKYGDDGGDVVHYLDGEPARDWRPNEGYCPECGSVVRTEGHGHDTEAYPFFRSDHYGFIWDNRASNVVESIGVPTVPTATLGDFT